MNEFEFSIRANLRRAWNIFAKHYVYFIVLGLVMMVFGMVSDNDEGILTILVALASLLWTYVGMSSVLAAVDGKEQMLSFDALKLHLPSVKQFLLLILLSIAMLIFVSVGFILLIIPGIYFAVRLCMANLAFVDRKEGVVASMKYSWNLVKGKVFWTVFLVLLVSCLLMFIGIILFGVGVIVAYPIATLLLALLYRALGAYRGHATAVTPQPAEIPPVPVSGI